MCDSGVVVEEEGLGTEATVGWGRDHWGVSSGWEQGSDRVHTSHPAFGIPEALPLGLGQQACLSGFTLLTAGGKVWTCGW